ncbi:MAG: glyoxalase [Micropruina sp.]|uniref:VOC family protein n=1 Tax=Micropruina sp. TaxID=2737536 RepID=UPI0039E5ACB9
MKLHHVQVIMPTGGDDGARAFWRDAVGLTEVTPPPELAGRPVRWFRAFDELGAITLEVHVLADEHFVPARLAHPAILVNSVAELEALGQRIASSGFELSWDQRTTFAGYQRFHCWDAFGNRVEVMTPDQ